MKEAIHQKSGNKAWLQSLVDTKATDASKRILLSKLMEENHATISKELDKIRFSKSIMINNKPNPVPELPDVAIKDKTEESVIEMNDYVKIEIIDLSDLPQALFTQIEDFIKKEIPEASEFTEAEVEDDIVEVPVPPKPIPEVVTLEEPDEQIQLEPDSEANSAKLNKARTAFQMSLNKDSELNINSNTIPEIITDSEQLIFDSNQLTEVNEVILEVPVPPKPIPQVVTLKEPDEQVQLDPDSNADKELNGQEEKNVNENTFSSARKTTKNNFTCQICEKAFQSNWKLKRHEKIHVKAGELLEATDSDLNLNSNTISDSEESNSDSNLSPDDSQRSLQNDAKLDRLKILSEEESSLYQELNLIEEQKNQIMSRLDYLRELRSQILFE